MRSGGIPIIPPLWAVLAVTADVLFVAVAVAVWACSPRTGWLSYLVASAVTGGYLVGAGWAASRPRQPGDTRRRVGPGLRLPSPAVVGTCAVVGTVTVIVDVAAVSLPHPVAAYVAAFGWAGAGVTVGLLAVAGDRNRTWWRGTHHPGRVMVEPMEVSGTEMPTAAAGHSHRTPHWKCTARVVRRSGRWLGRRSGSDPR